MIEWITCPKCGASNHKGRTSCDYCLTDLTQESSTPSKGEMSPRLLQDNAQGLPRTCVSQAQGGEKVSPVQSQATKNSICRSIGIAICQNCYAEYTLPARFCTSCGKPLNNPQKVPTEKTEEYEIIQSQPVLPPVQSQAARNVTICQTCNAKNPLSAVLCYLCGKPLNNPRKVPTEKIKINTCEIEKIKSPIKSQPVAPQRFDCCASYLFGPNIIFLIVKLIIILLIPIIFILLGTSSK